MVSISRIVSGVQNRLNGAAETIYQIKNEEEKLVPETKEELEQKRNNLNEKLGEFDISISDAESIIEYLNDGEVGKAIKLSNSLNMDFDKFTEFLNIYFEYDFIEGKLHLKASLSYLNQVLNFISEKEGKVENSSVLEEEVSSVEELLVKSEQQIEEASTNFKRIINLYGHFIDLDKHGDKFEERLEQKWEEESQVELANSNELEERIDEVRSKVESLEQGMEP
jgi:hypothetical protein